MADAVFFAFRVSLEIIFLYFLVIHTRNLKKLLRDIREQMLLEENDCKTNLHITKRRKHISPIEIEEYSEEIEE